jgi:hypothetical protein
LTRETVDKGVLTRLVAALFALSAFGTVLINPATRP